MVGWLGVGWGRRWGGTEGVGGKVPAALNLPTAAAQARGAPADLGGGRALAAAAFWMPNARTTPSGMTSRGPPILKFCRERWVWAPQYLRRPAER